MRILLTALTVLSSFLVSIAPVFADNGIPHGERFSLSHSILALDTFPIAIGGFGIIVVLMTIAAIFQTENESLKKFFFGTVVIVSLAVTGVFLAQTTTKNILSETGGPVHWHADFRIFNCYEEIDIIDPTGFLNRVGTPEIHEHGDKRMHVEGTLLDMKDASLGHFFKVIGGSLTSSSMSIPTNLGIEKVKNGDICKTNGEKEGEVQVFVWQTEDGVARQQKLENFTDYIISPSSPVPDGDCIIVEFGPKKDATTHLCEQYQVAEKKGNLIIEKPL